MATESNQDIDIAALMREYNIILKYITGKAYEKLNKYIRTKTNTWRTCDIQYLRNELNYHVQKYLNTNDKEQLPDIVNYCAMLLQREP